MKTKIWTKKDHDGIRRSWIFWGRRPSLLVIKPTIHIVSLFLSLCLRESNRENMASLRRALISAHRALKSSNSISPTQTLLRYSFIHSFIYTKIQAFIVTYTQRLKLWLFGWFLWFSRPQYSSGLVQRSYSTDNSSNLNIDLSNEESKRRLCNRWVSVSLLQWFWKLLVWFWNKHGFLGLAQIIVQE